MYQSSRPQAEPLKVSVTPKRHLAERLLRSVEASRSVNKAPKSALRVVEVRCVIASKNGLPRWYASSWEGPKTMLTRMVHLMKRTAQASKFQRLTGRFAGSNNVGRVEELSSIEVASVASKSRLH